MIKGLEQYFVGLRGRKEPITLFVWVSIQFLGFLETST